MIYERKQLEEFINSELTNLPTQLITAIISMPNKESGGFNTDQRRAAAYLMMRDGYGKGSIQRECGLNGATINLIARLAGITLKTKQVHCDRKDEIKLRNNLVAIEESLKAAELLRREKIANARAVASQKMNNHPYLSAMRSKRKSDKSVQQA